MTLCIVDMQPFFKASGEVLASVIKQIEDAKKSNSGIVILEFEGCGPTHDKILSVLGNYEYKAFAKKDQDDGSREFLKAARKSKFSVERVAVVGVNRGYCVLATAAGLIRSKMVKKIDVVLNATWGTDPFAEEADLIELSRHPSGKVMVC